MRPALIRVSTFILVYAPVTMALVALVYLYWWMLSQATWNLIGFGWRGDTYDSLASSLLQGKADVDPARIQVEVFKINGRNFMYFGPFPAIFRLPFVVAGSSWITQLSPLSCFVAAMISVGSFALLCFYHARRNPVLSAVLLCGFGAGTPLLFLSVSTSIYHEAIMWGLAGAMASLVSALMILYGSGRPHIWLSLCAMFSSVAVLSRMTFGVSAYIALAVGFLIIVRSRRFHALKSPMACAPALVGCCVQLWYNHARFGSPFAPAKFGPDVHYFDPTGMGGWFNPIRIPELLKIYFLPGTEFFFGQFPYVRMQRVNFTTPEIFNSWKEPVAPLTLTTTWLVVLALASVLLMARRRAWFLLFIALSFTCSWLPILSFFNVSERFTAEFLPGLVFITTCGMAGEMSWLRSTGLRAMVTILVLWSIFCTAVSTIAWPPEMTGLPVVSPRLESIFAGKTRLF